MHHIGTLVGILSSGIERRLWRPSLADGKSVTTHWSVGFGAQYLQGEAIGRELREDT